MYIKIKINFASSKVMFLIVQKDKAAQWLLFCEGNSVVVVILWVIVPVFVQTLMTGWRTEAPQPVRPAQTPLPLNDNFTYSAHTMLFSLMHM